MEKGKWKWGRRPPDEVLRIGCVLAHDVDIAYHRHDTSSAHEMFSEMSDCVSGCGRTLLR